MQVVANCLYVLQQAGMLEGRVTRQLVISLLNHIRSFRQAPVCGFSLLEGSAALAATVKWPNLHCSCFTSS